MKFILDKGRNHFLVGRPQAEFTAVTIFQAEHFRAVYIPASAFFPDFGRLNNGHHDFLGPGPVHFLTNDLFNLLDALPGKGKITVQATGNLPDISGPKHKLMAFENGFCRDLAKSGCIQLRTAHY